MSLNKSKVFQEYNFPGSINCCEGKWQGRNYSTIQGFIEKYVTRIASGDSVILNVTTTSHSYGLPEKNVQYFDVTTEKATYFPNTQTYSSKLISDEAYDIIVCTRNVLNYIDPMEAFEKFNRLLRKDGLLLLEFENSNSLELLFKKEFNKKAVFVNASNQGKQQQWHYSDSWINEILTLNKLEAIQKRKFNYFLFSQQQISEDENRGGIFAKLDSVLRFVPFARNFASNTIVLCQKKLAS